MEDGKNLEKILAAENVSTMNFNADVFSGISKLTNLAIKLNSYELALKYSNLLLEKYPDKPYSFYIKGWLFLVNDQEVAAIAAFKKAINIDSGYKERILKDNFCSKNSKVVDALAGI